MPNPYTKFEVFILSCSEDISRGAKFYNGPPDPDHAPPREHFFIGRVVLAMINLWIKFKVPKSTRYKAMNGREKYTNWDSLWQLGVTQGHRQDFSSAWWDLDHRITQTTPHDSPGTLVYWRRRSPRNSTGVTPYEDAKCRWGGSKSATFDK